MQRNNYLVLKWQNESPCEIGAKMSIKEKVCSFHNLYKATQKSKRNVAWKDSVARFSNHSLRNVHQLKQNLDNDTYKINPYSHFEIYEPKHRFITSTRFKDRVFQKSLCDNYLYHEITRHFISNNFACQLGKGTDKARKCLLYMLNNKNNYYALKIDIHDYFGSTDHELLKECLKQYIRDSWVLEKVEAIIDSFDKGIGLGSQVSQLMQLAYLNDLDHIITENWHIKDYIRYMDDIIVIHKDKTYLHKILRKIIYILKDKKLVLNYKKTKIIKLTNPIHFLGYSYLIKPSGKVSMKVLPSNLKKRKRKLKKQLRILDIESIEKSYQCWRAFAKHNRSAIHKLDKYKEALIMDKKDVQLVELRGLIGQERAETEFAKDTDERNKAINEAICSEYSLSTQIAILRKALVSMGCEEAEFVAFNKRVEEIKAEIGE